MADVTRLWSVPIPLTDVIAGRTLVEWVDVLHRYNCNKRGCKYAPLAPGAFGFEILAVSALALAGATQDTDRNALGALVHSAWAQVYCHWRDNPPAPPYRLPHVPLGDDERNQCAWASFADLSASQRIKDLIVVDGFLAARYPSETVAR